MKQVTATPINDRKVWENFLSTHPEANFLQSWEWGEFHKNLNKVIFRIGFFMENKLEGVMVSVVEDAKRGRYLTVPAGPIIDWDNKALISVFVSEVKKQARESGSIFVRCRPQLLATEERGIFKKLGFKDAPIHLHAELTLQLNLIPSEEELLINMRKTTRYEIKKAQSLGIKIETSDDLSDLDEFYKLQLSTAKRQGFVPFSVSFLKEQFKVFAASGKVLLYKAYLKKSLLAEGFIIFYGQEAVYHYGVSTDEGRKYPGAYLLLWEAIKEAKKRGMKRFNFWGAAPANQPNHRFYGISIFKRGFGGENVEYLHAQDLIIDYPRYLINWIIETTRRLIRKV